MNPRFEILSEKKLVGEKMAMSFANHTINELWRSFLPRKKEISNNLSNELISMVIYATNHSDDFKLTNIFERWAVVEVSDFYNIPNNMSTFILAGGLYAVFDYKGLSTDNTIFEYIFGTWLPTSDYMLDNRPHFEILGEKYKNNDPNSEEEIWIPIKHKIRF